VHVNYKKKMNAEQLNSLAKTNINYKTLHGLVACLRHPATKLEQAYSYNAAALHGVRGIDRLTVSRSS